MKFDIPWKTLNDVDWKRYIDESFLRVKKTGSKEYKWMDLGCKKDVPPKSEIDFSFPQTGAYNYSNGVVIYLRKYTRQYKRGICKSNSIFLNPLNSFERVPLEIKMEVLNEKTSFSLNKENLKKLFSSKYVGFGEAFKSIMDGKKLARAVTPELFLTIGANTPSPILWFNREPVGYVLDIDRIELANEFYRQEVMDSLRKIDLKFEEKE